MNTKYCYLLLTLLSLMTVPAPAQIIKGDVADRENRHSLAGVNIRNVHTTLTVSTGDNGNFVIAAGSDQLLEFTKKGYQTVRVRIPKGMVPPYFKILMQQGITPIRELLASNDNRYDYKEDSLRFYELYKHELEFPKLSAIGSIQHPFSAMSKKNREIWRFQESYTAAEKEKYVDRTFNKEVITKYTGLTGDSLSYYMVKYRPDYEDLRGMNDYTFFSYIKRTAYTYRNYSRGRSAQ